MERAIGDRSGRRVAAGCAVVVASLVLGCGDSSGPDDRAFDLDLAVGDTAVLETGGDIVRVGFPAASQPREYRVAVQSAARTLGRTPMRLRITNGGNGSSSRISAARRGALDAPEMSPEQRGLLWRTRLQTNAKQLLQRRGIRPARRSPRPGGDGIEIRRESMLPSGSIPQEGDRVQFWFSVQEGGGTSCDTAKADTVTADVVAVGNRVAFVEDTAVDDAASTQMNYDSLAQAFDDDVFGVNVEYFGTPTDIDGSQRVYVLLTPEVNRLSDPDGETTIAGFFNPIDLADSGDPDKSGEDATTAGQQDGTCEASNEAEVLYLVAPDPSGEFGQEVGVDQAKRSVIGTSAHEFQHLLNAANRAIKAQGGTFRDLEDTWLDEGLSHVAEEVVGLSVTGERLRSNLTLSEVVESPREEDVFLIFHIGNFDNLSRYLQTADTTRTIAASDPQGVASLRMRGFGWNFLRWLADREHPNSTGVVPDDPETGFFRDLAKAGGGDLSTGIANVEQAAGRAWEELLDDYGLMPAAEDDVAGAPQATQTLTWNLRDVFRRLHEAVNPGGNPDDPFPFEYPLRFHENDFSRETVDFEVQGSTQKYFRFASSGSTPRLTLELTNQSGQALSASSSVRILVIRAR